MMEEVKFHEISTQFVPPALTPDHLVIDGLFGSGLNKPLSGGFAAVVKYINSSPAMVVAIDIPSGLMGRRKYIQRKSQYYPCRRNFQSATAEARLFFRREHGICRRMGSAGHPIERRRY